MFVECAAVFGIYPPSSNAPNLSRKSSLNLPQVVNKLLRRNPRIQPNAPFVIWKHAISIIESSDIP